MRTILGRLATRARIVLEDNFLAENRSEILHGYGADEALVRWSESDRRPLVLLIDEIDALLGDALLSVLRQLRSGYDLSPVSFPHSIVLCGVRDYRIHSGSTGEIVAGGSAFNVSAASVRLGEFDRREVEALLGQHTDETSQRFEPTALERLDSSPQGLPEVGLGSRALAVHGTASAAPGSMQVRFSARLARTQPCNGRLA